MDTMRRKQFITFSLLFVIAFSIFHEYTFAFIDEDHCSATEYVHEMVEPVDKGDICDIHFEYHIAYILPTNNTFIQVYDITSKPIIDQESYNFVANLDFIKPPIT